MENLGPYTNFHELNQDWFLQEFNKLIAQWEAMQKSFDNLQDAFNDLKKYVQDYFKNLNVQEEINNKLNSMIADGSLITIISPTIRNSTSEWLNTHITNPSSPPIDTSLSVTKAAPDSKITGNYADKFAISCSFDKLDVNYVHDDNSITFTVDCGNSGILYGKHKFFIASAINRKSAVFNINSSFLGDTFFITLNANTLKLEVYSISGFIPITNVIFYVFSIDSDFNIIDIVYNPYKEKINYIYPTLGTETLSIFNKIVCCGDSYTSGHISTPTSTTSENEEYAWPKYLSNLTGSTCINCGKSGANVIDWQTTDRGLPKAKKSGVAQCYILGLGLNDYSDSTRHVDLGTTNDIGTDANTYYGGYSKIIRELHAISPKSIIFCLTMPFVNNSNIGYNNAIEYIANSYKNIYNTKLINLNKYIDYYKYSIVDNNAVGGHYSPAGYQLLAKILCIALSDYINTHPKEFYDVNLIPYDK
jgi:lysophospholipase L1-like esterase